MKKFIPGYDMTEAPKKWGEIYREQALLHQENTDAIRTEKEQNRMWDVILDSMDQSRTRVGSSGHWGY